MKITAFNGSPRAEKGNTHMMVEAFLDGASSAGAETENIFLSQKNIKHCIGCFACWLKTPGKCVHKDDMADLLTKFQSSDVIVLATPLYVDNVTGIMKNFLDRMIPLAEPFMDFDKNGESVHKNRMARDLKFVIISNCGFPEQSHFQVLRLYFRRVARNTGASLIGEIYRGEGELLKRDSLLLKPVIWNYKRLLKKAGSEVVRDERISETTTAELEKSLIAKELYVKEANKGFEAMLKKIQS